MELLSARPVPALKQVPGRWAGFWPEVRHGLCILGWGQGMPPEAGARPKFSAINQALPTLKPLVLLVRAQNPETDLTFSPTAFLELHEQMMCPRWQSVSSKTPRFKFKQTSSS